MQIPLIRLECGVNNYDWGKIGKESAAARFWASSHDDFTVEENKPYAELWMGTHHSNPSKDIETKRTLLNLCQDNQALLSQEIGEKYGQKLPFLFKVLSIGKALSIQAHPNKKLAEQLHQKNGKNYPDDNHKPEMTIAITPFDGFCGFRPLAEISHFLSEVEALRKLVGDAASEAFLAAVKGKETSEIPEDERQNKKALQELFGSLMNTKPEAVELAAKELVAAAHEEGASFAGNGGPTNTGKELSDLVIRLNSQFPNDIGLFVLFFLNYVVLSPGEAMFLKADDIHAYLSGDVIECMASSDNVVRAGLTPKFKDVPTLVSMLTYSYAPISEQKMDPVDYPYVTMNVTAYSSNSDAILYDPPIEEFSVVKTALKKKGAKATFDPIQGPSIIICTAGQGKISVGPKAEDVKPGYVYFVGAMAECVLESTGDGNVGNEDGQGFVTFKAFCELQGKEDTNGGENL